MDSYCKYSRVREFEGSRIWIHVFFSYLHKYVLAVYVRTNGSVRSTMYIYISYILSPRIMVQITQSTWPQYDSPHSHELSSSCIALNRVLICLKWCLNIVWLHKQFLLISVWLYICLHSVNTVVLKYLRSIRQYNVHGGVFNCCPVNPLCQCSRRARQTTPLYQQQPYHL